QATKASHSLLAGITVGLLTVGGVWTMLAVAPWIGHFTAFIAMALISFVGTAAAVAFVSLGIRIVRAFHKHNPNMQLSARLTEPIATARTKHPAFALLNNRNAEATIRYHERRHRLGDDEKRVYFRQSFFMLQFYPGVVYVAFPFAISLLSV